MLKQAIKTCSQFLLAKRIRGLAPKLGELEPFLCEEVKNAKYLRNPSGHIILSDVKTAAIFLFFEVETYFLACKPIFGSTRGVQKELDKNLFFPRNHRGGIYPPPPAWNKLYQRSRGIGLSIVFQTLKGLRFLGRLHYSYSTHI